MLIRLPLGVLAVIFTGVPSNTENIRLTEERIAALTAARQSLVDRLEEGHTKALLDELAQVKQELKQAGDDLRTFKQLHTSRN
ncbi:MAG TPA: hypothetical protein VGH19_06860 [Verrucomicrobiae bacterium]